MQEGGLVHSEIQTERSLPALGSSTEFVAKFQWFWTQDKLFIYYYCQ